VVPMPMHWWKRGVRGFNQAELQAKEIARKRGLPVRNAVRKRKATAAQAGLTNAARLANVAGAFEIRHRDAVADKRVLLVDDVMTTGATASACANALKRAGAREVTLIAVARTDRRAFAPVETPAGPHAFSESYLYGSLEDAKSGPIA
ncbi:MAG: ComF family protein, partial [Bryobacteraceae bacterium]